MPRIKKTTKTKTKTRKKPRKTAPDDVFAGLSKKQKRMKRRELGL